MLIPDGVEEFNSKGEHILYLKFRNDSSARNYYILHSLFTNFHIKAPSGEIDFLILVPGHGFFAIEVKHGRVRREKGMWFFENRSGQITKDAKGPFVQVSDTMHSIRNYLLDKLQDHKLRERFSKILFGSGVAFTSMEELPDIGPECFPWQVLTRNGLNLQTSTYIQTLSAGWHSANRGKYWYDTNHSRPTDEDCQAFIQIMRGDFEVDYSEINKIFDHENLIEEFTKEQFQFLDFIHYNQRCLIQGQAGTGKTLMVLESARRLLESGKKVAILCFNTELGKKLTGALGILTETKTAAYFCGTLHSLLMLSQEHNIPSVNQATYFSETLPLEFLIRDDNPEHAKYDVLIVDEAQDLITPYYLEIFDYILKDGMSNGNWIFLGDFSNQAIYQNDPDVCIRILNEKARFTSFPPLKINCRNTKKIALHNTLLTGVSPPHFRAKNLEGVPIETKFPATNFRRSIVDQIISDLMDSGIPLNKITILSPKRLENTFLKDSELINKLITTGLQFFTIQAYKGLENAYVILCDFDELESIEAQRLLYVGISRAKLRLFLVLDHKLEKAYSSIVNKNIHLVI